MTMKTPQILMHSRWKIAFSQLLRVDAIVSPLKQMWIYFCFLLVYTNILVFSGDYHVVLSVCLCCTHQMWSLSLLTISCWQLNVLYIHGSLRGHSQIEKANWNVILTFKKSTPPLFLFKRHTLFQCDQKNDYSE